MRLTAGRRSTAGRRASQVSQEAIGGLLGLGHRVRPALPDMASVVRRQRLRHGSRRRHGAGRRRRVISVLRLIWACRRSREYRQTRACRRGRLAPTRGPAPPGLLTPVGLLTRAGRRAPARQRLHFRRKPSRFRAPAGPFPLPPLAHRARSAGLARRPIQIDRLGRRVGARTAERGHSGRARQGRRCANNRMRQPAQPQVPQAPGLPQPQEHPLPAPLRRAPRRRPLLSRRARHEQQGQAGRGRPRREQTGRGQAEQRHRPEQDPPPRHQRHQRPQRPQRRQRRLRPERLAPHGRLRQCRGTSGHGVTGLPGTDTVAT